MSTLEVNKITPVGVGTSVTLGDSGDTFTIPSGVTLTNNGTASGFPGLGKIGQVVQGTQTGTSSSTSGSFSDVGLSASITPTSISSKVLVTVTGAFGSGTTGMAQFRLLRDSTEIGTSDASSFGSRTTCWLSDTPNNSERMNNYSFSYLDSPSSTSSLTYKTQWRLHDTSGGKTIYANRTSADTDNANSGRAISVITLQEVLA